jgi:hypothetical protein
MALRPSTVANPQSVVPSCWSFTALYSVAWKSGMSWETCVYRLSNLLCWLLFGHWSLFGARSQHLLSTLDCTASHHRRTKIFGGFYLLWGAFNLSFQGLLPAALHTRTHRTPGDDFRGGWWDVSGAVRVIAVCKSDGLLYTQTENIKRFE